MRAVAGPVWVFDPQGITLEEASWWWNPLSYVTDEVRAARLAEHFAAGLPADPRGRPHPLGYFTLVMLSEAPDRTLRMTALAARTNATLPRQSRVVARLEREGYIERRPCADDGRATNAVLTEAGLTKLTQAAPGHLATVRHYVIDALTPTQLQQLSRSCARMLAKLDPTERMFFPPQGSGNPAPASAAPSRTTTEPKRSASVNCPRRVQPRALDCQDSPYGPGTTSAGPVRSPCRCWATTSVRTT